MRRSTIILLIIFFALGIFVWYMQQPANPIKLAIATSTITPSFGTDNLISPGNDPIKQISIQDANGKMIIVEKTNTNWVIKTDKTIPADQSMAESAAGECLNVRILKTLEKTPDPAGTGLDKPAYLISCKLESGSVVSFKVGKITATGIGYYAEVTNSNVYILGKSEVDALIQILDQPPFLTTIDPGFLVGTESPGIGIPTVTNSSAMTQTP